MSDYLNRTNNTDGLNLQNKDQQKTTNKTQTNKNRLTYKNRLPRADFQNSDKNKNDLKNMTLKTDYHEPIKKIRLRISVQWHTNKWWVTILTISQFVQFYRSYCTVGKRPLANDKCILNIDNIIGLNICVKIILSSRFCACRHILLRQHCKIDILSEQNRQKQNLFSLFYALARLGIYVCI